MNAGPARFDLRRLFSPGMIGLAAIRVAVVVALLSLGLALLALLGEAQRGPQRKLQVSDTAWEPALVTGLASIVPMACLALCLECILPMLAQGRVGATPMLLLASGALALVGAWAAWTILGLDADAVRPKQFALAAAAGLLFLLVGSLHAALWLAAHRPEQDDLHHLPFAWHLALATLAALALGGRWGWAALDPHLRLAADRRRERWSAPAAPPLRTVDAPEDRWAQ